MQGEKRNASRTLDGAVSDAARLLQDADKTELKLIDVGRFSAKVKKRAEKRTFLPFWAKKEQKKALFRPKNLHK